MGCWWNFGGVVDRCWSWVEGLGGGGWGGSGWAWVGNGGVGLVMVDFVMGLGVVMIGVGGGGDRGAPSSFQSSPSESYLVLYKNFSDFSLFLGSFS